MILSKASLRVVSATVSTNLCAQSTLLQPECQWWLCIIYSSQVFPSDLRIFTIIHVVPVRNSRISRELSRAVGVALLMWIISASPIAKSIRVVHPFHRDAISFALQFLLFGCPSFATPASGTFSSATWMYLSNPEFKLPKHRKHLSLPRHPVAGLWASPWFGRLIYIRNSS